MRPSQTSRRAHSIFRQIRFLVMVPIFIFIALPVLSLALVLAILIRRLRTPEPRLRARRASIKRAMSRLEALQLLGLEGDADRGAIRTAYKRLMARYHPDRGGSHQTAAQLNLARDTLLQKRKGWAA
ncbi:MAG: DnaJ domain-containing protein [Bdellovibrionales bacterium]